MSLAFSGASRNRSKWGLNYGLERLEMAVMRMNGVVTERVHKLQTCVGCCVPAHGGWPDSPIACYYAHASYNYGPSFHDYANFFVGY